ncbi:MAG: DNA repair protein RecN [Pseudomonadota bacterium]|nr:DNA repair protein RecN [Pseudomonadota bacterium]
MLAALSIRDIVLIDRLDLEFGRGMSVLTGETGAGKSILLDAFALALGARGDASLVRSGAEQGQVTAVFALNPGHPVLALLAENELPGDGDLILRRIQSADGRTRAFVNDAPVSAQLLRRVGELLVEIHGQHDDRAMTDPSTHRDLLDAFAGLTAEARSAASLHEALKDADTALAEHKAQIARVREGRDYLEHAVEELRTLAPQPGEEAELSSRRQVMMHSEKIASDLEEALAALSGDDGRQSRLAAALRKLERQPAEVSALTGPIAAALERVVVETNDARDALEQALERISYEPKELEAAEERLFALRALARKHQVPVDGLAALVAKFEGELAALDAGEETLEQLGKAAKAAHDSYRKAAEKLSAQRRKAATRLDEEVMAELPPLKLEKAKFITGIESVSAEQGGPQGLDRVTFTVQTNPGTAAGPMMKVASGGELARFMLALKVVLAARGSAPTLIFDEIDTGVGGATASAIGERLARLSGDLQVLAVTHAPQVAAQATGHLRITKESVARGVEAVATRVAVLDSTARREEIARMLAGQVITEEARAAADRLIGGQA